MRREPLTIDRLPLYATDEEIGEAVLGSERKREFKDLAILLERQGMPKISPLMGGRYVPAVRKFFDVYNGVPDLAPVRTNPVEGEWTPGRNGRRVRA
jgi:hypothetical protein